MTLKQRYAFPRVTTRGHYDLRTGANKKTTYKDYFLYPKYKFDKFDKVDEIVVFVHGMRNTRWGAIHGARLLRNKLRKLGYKHPVIAFSYDAEIREAHKPESYNKVLNTAFRIAKNNGIYNLTKFINDFKREHPFVKIRLVGHSLGCDVISHINTEVYSIDLFGSPVEEVDLIRFGQGGKAVYITNHYNPKDDVIKEGIDKGIANRPTCIFKINSKFNNIKSKLNRANDHRFSSYLKGLKKFP